MRLFITGATGLIGRRLVLDRLEHGDGLVVLSRHAARAEARFAASANPNVEIVEGDPAEPGAWQDAVDGCDGVVHLAGAGISDRRWSTSYKREIVNSRVDGTHQVVEAIRAASRAPTVLVNASAVGFYGDTGARETDETAPAATGDFLGDLCVRWEAEAMKAEEMGTRVVPLRTGAVLDERGGLLGSLLPPFRMFVGGPIGSGRQYVPWIHWRDLIGLIDLALRRPDVRGPLNGTAPEPVTNRRFALALGRAIGRPSWLPVPSFAVRIAIGELARYATMSQRVVPAAALRLGYAFVHREIEPAMEALLGPSSVASEPGREAPDPPPPIGAPGGAPPEAGPPIRLLAVSVDGALLRGDGQLARGVVQACREAQRSGCAIVLATARPPRSVRSILDALDVIGPTINYNGAVIWNPLDDRPQYHEPLDAAVAKAVIDAARDAAPDILVGIEVLDRWFTDRVDPARAPAVDPDGIGPLDEFLAAPVTQLNLFGPGEVITAAMSVVRERFWRERAISLFRPRPSLIQIMHPLVDKAIALQRIAARSGIDRAAVMAIGDGANDLGMLEWAGLAVATGNAADPVKAVARAAVPGNDDQGVAIAVRRFLLPRQ